MNFFPSFVLFKRNHFFITDKDETTSHETFENSYLEANHHSYKGSFPRIHQYSQSCIQQCLVFQFQREAQYHQIAAAGPLPLPILPFIFPLKEKSLTLLIFVLGSLSFMISSSNKKLQFASLFSYICCKRFIVG